jgi:hypothetical protein
VLFVLSILHVLTLGYENTCKGTSKEHLTIKIMSRKFLDCLLSQKSSKGQFWRLKLRAKFQVKDRRVLAAS